jgi:hypothetical protein
MQKWEYKVMDRLPSQEQLNELGSQGWELISVAVAGGNSSLCKEVAYLKRQTSD